MKLAMKVLWTINYREIKKGIRMMNSRIIYTKKINIIEKSKKIGIDKVIKRYEIINKLKVSNIKQCHLII